jgi:hypothetical protein
MYCRFRMPPFHKKTRLIKGSGVFVYNKRIPAKAGINKHGEQKKVRSCRRRCCCRRSFARRSTLKKAAIHQWRSTWLTLIDKIPTSTVAGQRRTPWAKAVFQLLQATGFALYPLASGPKELSKDNSQALSAKMQKYGIVFGQSQGAPLWHVFSCANNGLNYNAIFPIAQIRFLLLTSRRKYSII